MRAAAVEEERTASSAVHLPFSGPPWAPCPCALLRRGRCLQLPQPSPRECGGAARQQKSSATPQTVGEAGSPETESVDAEEEDASAAAADIEQARREAGVERRCTVGWEQRGGWGVAGRRVGVDACGHARASANRKIAEDNGGDSLTSAMVTASRVKVGASGDLRGDSALDPEWDRWKPVVSP